MSDPLVLMQLAFQKLQDDLVKKTDAYCKILIINDDIMATFVFQDDKIKTAKLSDLIVVEPPA